MVAKVQSNADQLAGPGDRRSQPDRCRNSRRGSGVLLQPLLQTGESVICEKRFVIILHAARNIQARAVFRDDPRSLSACFTKSDQLHRIISILVSRLASRTLAPRTRVGSAAKKMAMLNQ